MAISCHKRSPCFDNFPNVFRVFCVFSHGVLVMFSSRFIVHIYSFSSYFTTNTAQHSTQHTHSQTHTLTHTCTPATDRDLESGLSKSRTRKNPGKCLKKAKSGETLERARADVDGQIVRLRRSDDRPIEPSGNWFPPNFPSFSRKKAND